ncbi:septin-5-like isoform X2 [Hyalella azteca]|uniref:Septin n=1 Tax=Hyalella azteca TaxID=294128 RepID=A0A8B7NZN3_HYAAZ|nr:septin-5-like isoform X2 [Hyalella azteca]
MSKLQRIDDGEGTREMIGFATLPEQVHRKTVKRGFEFTLLVVGEAGLGKSTLVNSLFLTELYKDRKNPPVHGAIKKTVEIEKKTVEIEEKGVKLRLTVVDTPGFGDGVDCGDDWKSVERYVDEQFNKYFQDESGLNRRNIQDHRVHCCLYFVPPYGHGLRQLDVEFMKRLHRKVNIVPVVAKADTLTKAEIAKLKANLLRDIDTHKIKIYQFPDCDEDEDEEFQQQDRELKASIPFAVIGSNCIIEIAGRRVRGRQYPWGIVEVENAAHCDFVKLRTMLISTHMQDMKEVTQDIHYENFRAQCISHMNQVALKERSKLRRDSISAADVKRPVDDPGKLLEQKDEEIRRMQEMLSQMQQRLQGQHDPLNKLPPAKPPKPSAPSSLNKTPQGSSSRDSIINV